MLFRYVSSNTDSPVIKIVVTALATEALVVAAVKKIKVTAAAVIVVLQYMWEE